MHILFQDYYLFSISITNLDITKFGRKGVQTNSETKMNNLAFHADFEGFFPSKSFEKPLKH